MTTAIKERTELGRNLSTYFFDAGKLVMTLSAPSEESVAVVDAARHPVVLACSRAEAMALNHDWQTGQAVARPVEWGEWTVRAVAPHDVPDAKRTCTECGLPKPVDHFSNGSMLCESCEGRAP